MKQFPCFKYRNKTSEVKGRVHSKSFLIYLMYFCIYLFFLCYLCCNYVIIIVTSYLFLLLSCQPDIFCLQPKQYHVTVDVQQRNLEQPAFMCTLTYSFCCICFALCVTYVWNYICTPVSKIIIRPACSQINRLFFVKSSILRI